MVSQYYGLRAMKIRELLAEAAPVGREYQHLEDLLIINGAKGGLEALEELRHAAAEPSSMDLKWDGGAAVFWGRDDAGQFVFAPKNQWSKKQQLDKDGLSYEIKSTGRAKPGQSAEEFAQVRAGMASKYEKLWDLFEAATPKNFRGYLNGDLMFTAPQTLNKQTNEYEFTPNKVTYHVAANGLGGKMAGAQAFVVVHGKIDEFGADATGGIYSVSASVVDKFNQTPGLIVLNTQTPQVKLPTNGKEIDQAVKFVRSNAGAIDEIANYTAPKFTTLKRILYDYAVARAKTAGGKDFAQWLESSKVSEPQRIIIRELMRKPSWPIFWAAFHQILDAKHVILDQLHSTGGVEMQNRLGIRSTVGGKQGGEGLVKKMKSGGMGKLVNPEFRSAPVNPQFAPDV